MYIQWLPYSWMHNFQDAYPLIQQLSLRLTNERRVRWYHYNWWCNKIGELWCNIISALSLVDLKWGINSNYVSTEETVNKLASERCTLFDLPSKMTSVAFLRKNRLIWCVLCNQRRKNNNKSSLTPFDTHYIAGVSICNNYILYTLRS